MEILKTKTVKYSDPYDITEQDLTEKSYRIELSAYSDVISFIREDNVVISFSRGEAWLFMKGMEAFLKQEGSESLLWENPFL